MEFKTQEAISFFEKIREWLSRNELKKPKRFVLTNKSHGNILCYAEVIKDEWSQFKITLVRKEPNKEKIERHLVFDYPTIEKKHGWSNVVSCVFTEYKKQLGEWFGLYVDNNALEAPKEVEETKPAPAFDVVQKPKHYNLGKVECIEAIESAIVGKNGLEAVYVGSIIKYLWRYEAKNGLEDVKKAKWYLDRLIKELEAKNG